MIDSRKVIACPFCIEGKIEVIIPTRSAISPYKGESNKIVNTSKYFIISEKCPLCGKTKEEICKKYTNKIDSRRVLERLTLQGMDTVIVEKY